MKIKNYNCAKCGDLVHAKALPDSIIGEGLCHECWCKRHGLGKYAKPRPEGSKIFGQ